MSTHQPWTEEESKILKEYLEECHTDKVPWKYIEDLFDGKRTKNAIQCHYYYLKKKNGGQLTVHSRLKPRWKKEETKTLLELYSGYKAEQLPNKEIWERLAGHLGHDALACERKVKSELKKL